MKRVLAAFVISLSMVVIYSWAALFIVEMTGDPWLDANYQLPLRLPTVIYEYLSPATEGVVVRPTEFGKALMNALIYFVPVYLIFLAADRYGARRKSR